MGVASGYAGFVLPASGLIRLPDGHLPRRRLAISRHARQVHAGCQPVRARVHRKELDLQRLLGECLLALNLIVATPG